MNTAIWTNVTHELWESIYALNRTIYRAEAEGLDNEAENLRSAREQLLMVGVRLDPENFFVG